MKQSLGSQILNDNFLSNGIHQAINSLKSNTIPGIDGIPVGFLKYCKDVFLGDIQYIFNYIIHNQNFPEIWVEGLRTHVYKNGDQYQPKNYLGMTVLSILGMVFEIAFCNRLTSVNERLKRLTKQIGPILKFVGDPAIVFVPNGLIERQLILGMSLYIFFVDFSNNSDQINRHTLFYEKSIYIVCWHGKIINTLRYLYSKTYVWV